MAYKTNWKKIGRRDWENKKTGKQIAIRKNDFSKNGWMILIGEPGDEKILKNNLTLHQAERYAKAYMRKY